MPTCPYSTINVLYGDGHAARYADQRKAIACWPMSTDWNMNLAYSGYTGELFDAADTRTTHSRTMGVMAWHMFDRAADLDENAETPSP